MKIFIIGHSGTNGTGLPESERLSGQLRDLLIDARDNREVDVELRGWGPRTDARLERLVDRIQQSAPDYLVLHIGMGAPNLNLVMVALMQRVPHRLLPLFKLLVRPHYAIEERLLRLRWSFLFSAYHAPLRFVGRRVFGSAALDQTAEALCFIDRLIRAVKQQESMEILVSARTERWWLANTPENRRLAMDEEDYRRQLVRLCRTQRIMFVPYRPADDILADGVHPGSRSNRLHAESLAEAIESAERSYR